MERRVEGLTQEVQALQGTLADYNLLVSKLRTTNDLQVILIVFYVIEQFLFYFFCERSKDYGDKGKVKRDNKTKA